LKWRFRIKLEGIQVLLQLYRTDLKLKFTSKEKLKDELSEEEFGLLIWRNKLTNY